MSSSLSRFRERRAKALTSVALNSGPEDGENDSRNNGELRGKSERFQSVRQVARPRRTETRITFERWNPKLDLAWIGKGTCKTAPVALEVTICFREGQRSQGNEWTKRRRVVEERV